VIAGEKKKLLRFSGKKNFKNCIVLSVNSRKITINNHDSKIIVKYFDKIDTNIYYLKEKYSITGTSLSDFCNIIKKLLNESEATLDDSKCISLIGRIKDFISNHRKTISIWLNYIYQIHMASQPYTSGLQAKQNKTQVNRRRTDQTIAIQKANSELQEAIEKANAAAKAVINAEKKATANLAAKAAANAATIATQKGKNQRQIYSEFLLNLNQWGPTSGQGSGLEHTHRTNWSKQPNYTSFTIQQQQQQQNNNKSSSNIYQYQ